MRHTFQCHSSTLDFSYSCGISGCIQTFNTYSAMVSHLQRKHPRFEVSTDDLNTNTPQEEGESVPQVFDDSQLDPVEMVDELSAKKSAALLLLNLKERHRLTQSAVNFTVGQIKQMMEYAFKDIKMSIQSQLHEVHLNLDQCFNINLFEGLETEYLQSKFYLEHFNLVVSNNLHLSTIMDIIVLQI